VVAQQYAVTLLQWHDCAVAVLRDDKGRLWFPIGTLCAALGVTTRFQIDRLREHAVLSRMVAQHGIRTRGGRQSTWCIERRGIGFWLGGLQLDRVRPEIRPRLLDFQEALVDAADRLFFGELASNPIRAQLTTHDRDIANVTRFALALEQRIGYIEERVLAEGE